MHLCPDDYLRRQLWSLWDPVGKGYLTASDIKRMARHIIEKISETYKDVRSFISLYYLYDILVSRRVVS